jgi:hypothetical protein
MRRLSSRGMMSQCEKVIAMPLPGLLGLFVTCFVCGALTAWLTGRRLSGLVGMAIALAAALAAPLIGETVGLPITSYWLLLAIIAAASLTVSAVFLLLPRRRRPGAEQ